MKTLKNVIVVLAFLALTLSFFTGRGCWAQELLVGRGDRWAETSETSAEFFATPTNSPPNVFIQINDIYIHFAEQSRGFLVYDKSSLIHSDPTIFTIQNQQYHFKIESGKVYRNDALVWETASGTVKAGTFQCSAQFQFIYPVEWDLSNGFWHLPNVPKQIDTLRAESVVVEWNHSRAEPDFSGFDVQAVRDGVLLANEQTVDLQTQFETPPGQYIFRVAAFDTVPNYSSYAETEAVILAPNGKEPEPTPSPIDTLIGNAIVASWAHLSPEPGMFFRVYWNGGSAKETAALSDTLRPESGMVTFQVSAVDSMGNETARVPNPPIEFYFQKYEIDFTPPSLPVMVEVKADTLK